MNRAREIVFKAALKVENAEAREWMRSDSKATFERMAQSYLDRAATPEMLLRAKENGLTDTVIDDQIARILALNALDAQIAEFRRIDSKLD